MPGIRVVIFDCYGTLVDILTNEGKESIFEHLALYLRYYGANTNPAALRSQYQVEKERYLDTRGERYPEFDLAEVFKTILRKEGLNDPSLVESCCKLFRLESRERFQLFPDALPALNELKRHNYPLAMLSNAQDIFFHAEIDMLGLQAYFGHFIVSSYWGFRKPDSRLFSVACALCNVNPSEAVYIGDDMKVDVKGAQSIGMKAVLIDREQKQKSREILPDYIATSLDKAVEWIMNLT